ncbi:MAG: hypothetical protein F6K22_00790 [Okeania sp. SIO2F4]|uniref:COP23 domain-containing protein n=1 Tax=Okeania sp. SIO2F4 TaxID=2607790 RepID=UPI00142A870E|nr:COP23 domain-containing protein [Okeania sp. SIO2F4]MDJ0519054.1 COP23 domain-containing protein [Trichodesmium sp. MO_231.B1]NES01504.1 hypothetical protein [Okeania sp. SIO2F4]
MKLKFCLKGSLVSILSLLSLAAFPLTVRANESIKDSCTSDSPVIKISRHAKQEKDLLLRELNFRFDQTFPNDLDRAQQLCQESSQKLQVYLNSGRELKIIPAKQNNRIIVCLTSEDSCTANSEELFALKAEESPELLKNLVEEKIPDKVYEDDAYLSTVGLRGNRFHTMLQMLIP